MSGLATASAGNLPAPIVSVAHISHNYPGVRALRDLSLELRAGEVHALVGENGAGKSTLIRVLSGDTRPDEGTISIRGKAVKFSSPSDARRHGIVAIFQELMIVPSSASPRTFCSATSRDRGPFLFAPRGGAPDSRGVAQPWPGVRHQSAPPAGSLSTAQKQIVEIARALMLQGPRHYHG